MFEIRYLDFNSSTWHIIKKQFTKIEALKAMIPLVKQKKNPTLFQVGSDIIILKPKTYKDLLEAIKNV